MCKARLSDNLHAWDAINAPDFVKTWIKEGIKIPFQVDSDTCTFELNNKHLNAKEVDFLDSEFSRLVRLDYIEEGLDGGVWYSLFIKNLAHYSSH